MQAFEYVADAAFSLMLPESILMFTLGLLISFLFAAQDFYHKSPARVQRAALGRSSKQSANGEFDDLELDKTIAQRAWQEKCNEGQPQLPEQVATDATDQVTRPATKRPLSALRHDCLKVIVDKLEAKDIIALSACTTKFRGLTEDPFVWCQQCRNLSVFTGSPDVQTMARFASLWKDAYVVLSTFQGVQWQLSSVPEFATLTSTLTSVLRSGNASISKQGTLLGYNLDVESLVNKDPRAEYYFDLNGVSFKLVVQLKGSSTRVWEWGLFFRKFQKARTVAGRYAVLGFGTGRHSVEWLVEWQKMNVQTAPMWFNAAANCDVWQCVDSGQESAAGLVERLLDGNSASRVPFVLIVDASGHQQAVATPAPMLFQ